MTHTNTEGLSELIKLVIDSPHPETMPGAHLSDKSRAQLAYAFIDNIKRKATELSRRAANSAGRVEVKGMPISTAPRDGTYILARQEGVLEPSFYVVAFDQSWGDNGWWMTCDGKDPELPLRGPEPAEWWPLPISSPAVEAEPVAWQWRALENGEPRTAWFPEGLGDQNGWEALAKRTPHEFTVEKRCLYTHPSSPVSAEVTEPDEMLVAALKGLVLLKDLFDSSDRNQADAYYILAKQDGAWGNARSALAALNGGRENG